MFRFTIRDVLWLMVVVGVAVGMYAAWQTDRALLALRLSQTEARALKAESAVAPIASEPYVVRESVISYGPNAPETVVKIYSSGSHVHETRLPGAPGYGTGVRHPASVNIGAGTFSPAPTVVPRATDEFQQVPAGGYFRTLPPSPPEASGTFTPVPNTGPATLNRP